MPTVHLLDYVAGNVRSLVNAIERVGYQVEWIRSPADVQNAEVSHHFDRYQQQYLTPLPVETYLARSWTFWALPLATLRTGFPRTSPATHSFREAFHGDLCRPASAL